MLIPLRFLGTSMRKAFCVVKEDGAEIGRTQESDIGAVAGSNTTSTQNGHVMQTAAAASTTTTIGASTTQTVSWETGGNANKFAVTLSPHRGGGLPLQLSVELWEALCDDKGGVLNDYSRSFPTSSGQGSTRTDHSDRNRNTAAQGQQNRVLRRVGSAVVGPDTLVLSSPGRLSVPLEHSFPNPKAIALDGTKAMDIGISPGVSASGEFPNGDDGDPANRRAKAEQADESDGLPPRVLLRITPQVGRHWGRRVMKTAGEAKRLIGSLAAAESLLSATPTPATNYSTSSAAPNDCRAHVVYMTNAQGSARTWRAPVTPGNSIPAQDFEEVMEIVFGSVPACCPRAPALLVAPVSDIGVRIGKVWIGPRIATRYAIVTHRPQHHHSNPNDTAKWQTTRTRNDKGGHLTSWDDGDGSAGVEPPKEDELFARAVAAKAEDLLREIRARDMRTEQRRTTLGRVREICKAWTQARERRANPPLHTGNRAGGLQGERGIRHKDHPTRITQGTSSDGTAQNDEKDDQRKAHDHESDQSGNESEDLDEDSDDDEHQGGREYGDLYRGVLRALEIALPGVCIYLGLVESGGQSIRYVACTRQSSMAGKELKQGEGISFSCVGPRFAPYIMYPPQKGSGSKGGERNPGSKQPRPTHGEGEDRAVLQVLLSAFRGKSTAASVEEVTESRDSRILPRQQTPQAERSLEEGVVYIQKVFRGKLARNQVKRAQHLGAPDNVKSTTRSMKGRTSRTKKSALLIPKVFDYEGRVGWPFVCIPLEGVLGSSSIGVMGLDTFEQMGTSGDGHDQPEAGVLQMLREAAR